MRDLIIDLDAIAKNLNTMRAKTNGALALAVIKADAYGHGMLPVAKKLEAAKENAAPTKNKISPGRKDVI